MNINCPGQLNDKNAIDFINYLDQYKETDHIRICFSSINFSFPFAIMLLAEYLKDFNKCRIENGHTTEFDLDDTDIDITNVVSYLMFFGFFKYIGIEIGNKPSFRSRVPTYIPISIIDLEEIDSRSGGLHQNIGSECSALSRIIDKREEDNNMLIYCFQEIIRNVFEHAEVSSCTLMGQSWYRGKLKGDVEIAIIDKGVGVYGSLQTTHHFNSIEEAIIESLKPGVSRVLQVSEDDKWGNSGYGLYVLSELGKEYGCFSICSNGKLYDLHKFSDIAFQGTAIKLHVNITESDYFPNILDKIVTQGENESEKIFGKRKSASISSSGRDLY